jgi:SAM-dependent methyltransferase
MPKQRAATTDPLMQLRKTIRRLPLLGPFAREVYWLLVKGKRAPKFRGSRDYWESRYVAGGNSGAGSYRMLAEFKAEILNELVEQEGIRTVIEYGCGDGNQLALARYPEYLGFDVSHSAISRCRELFKEDRSKSFRHSDSYAGERADLTLSLDVIYHLVEDEVFDQYMARLFDSSDRLVVIYSSNLEKEVTPEAPHVRHRRFSDWVDRMRPGWRLLEHIPNRYPQTEDNKAGSFADFYIYKKGSVGALRQK